LEKKCWLYKYDENIDYRFKGINDKAMCLDITEPPVWVNEVKRVNKQTGEREIGYAINQEFSKEINNYYYKNLDKCLKGLNAYELYKKLYTEKSAYVLTSSFRKITGNNAQSINADGGIDYAKGNYLSNQVILNHMIKKMQI